MIAPLFFIFAFIAIIFGLFVHESGHFLFAKLFKINVKEFSIGIGPTLFSKKYKGVKYSLRPFPVMAYVLIDSKKLISLYKEICEEQKGQMLEFKEKYKYQFNDPKILRKYEKLEKDLLKYEYLASSSNKILIDDVALWKQIIVYFGGVLVNLLFFIIFYLILAFGLTSIIETINNQLENGKTIDTNIISQTKNIFTNLFKNMIFYNAWKPEGASPSNGTIVGETIDISKIGITSEYLIFLIVNYFCMFNFILFLFNIIPFPPLDGFKILSTSLSKTKHFKISKKTENVLTYIGVAILIYIFITGIIADFL